MAVDITIPGASVGDEPGKRDKEKGPEALREPELAANEQTALQERGRAVLVEPGEVDEKIEGVAARVEAGSENAPEQGSDSNESKEEEEGEPDTEETADLDFNDDSDVDADADADALSLSTEEQAVLDAAKAAANEGAKGGTLAAAFAWISENVTKFFAWISGKIGGIFGKLGWKKDKEGKGKESEAGSEGEPLAKERYTSGEDIANLAVDIVNGEEPDVEFPAGEINCWRWVEGVYAAAGFDLSSAPKIYENIKGEGEAFADFDRLKPGDHVIYHNDNGIDENNNHSGIFIRWLNKDMRRAEVANFSGVSPYETKIDEVDFEQDEIRRVRQPEQKELERNHFEDAEMLDSAAPVFTFPAESYVNFSSNYGWRIHPIHGGWRFHEGVDFGAPEGTPVICTQDGCEVVSSGFYGDAGNMVTLRMSGGEETTFMHFAEIGPEVGTVLNRGDLIGYVGNTGGSTSAHLHFEVRRDGDDIDPSPHISESVRAEEMAMRERRQAEYEASPMA